jgi:hypothetical protein
MLINSYAFYLYINAPWFFKKKEGLIRDYLKSKSFPDNTSLDMFCRSIIGVMKGVKVAYLNEYIDFAEYFSGKEIKRATFEELFNPAVEELLKEAKLSRCEIEKLLRLGIPPLAIVGYKRGEVKTEFDALLWAKKVYGNISHLTEVDLVEILQNNLVRA